MAKIWRNRIIGGTQFFSECPAKYRDAVLALLKDDVKKGVITADRFEELTGLEYAE